MQSASEQVIPAGMKPWSGGDQKPVDWDGGPVLLANGKIDTWPVGHQWLAPFGDNYVIAYTPKPLPSPAPMVEQAGEVIQADREAEADEYRMRRWEDDDCEDVIRKIRSGELDIWTSIQERARHRLNTRPAPAETEGVGQLSDEIRGALKAAYEQGAADVHTYWTENPGEPPRGDPEFGEAAADYANEAMNPLSSAARGLALSTPPADAGMLREALEQCATSLQGFVNLIGEPRRDGSARIGAALSRETIQAALVATNDALAALNSQAHQIREGDHG